MRQKLHIDVSIMVTSVIFGWMCGCAPSGGGSDVNQNSDTNENDNANVNDNENENSTGSGVVSNFDLSAWEAGRIVYADFESGELITVTEEGTAAKILAEIEGAACPAVSGDSQTMALSSRTQSRIIVLGRGGDVREVEGLTGHDPFRATLNGDGSRLAFQEVVPPEPINACGPIHLVVGDSDGTDLTAEVTGDSICAEWPEWSPAGDLLSYAHVDLDQPPGLEGQLCILNGESLAQITCLADPIISIGHRTFSPDGTMLMAQAFRVISASDGMEVPDPLAAAEGTTPVLAAGDLGNAIVNAVDSIGFTLLAGGDGGEVLPISVDWSPDHKLVFDALASVNGGEESVHIFVYDMRTGSAQHISGPFEETDTNDHNYSLLCPRWISD